MKTYRQLSAAIFILILISLTACAGVTPAIKDASIGTCSVAANGAFENRLETDHFVLYWTSRNNFCVDNISDPNIIKETAGYLETAWKKYVDLFGRKPYTAPGHDKIDVVFHKMDCYGLADPPDGPIQLNAQAWVQRPGIRKPTSAHELFHKLQYAYGYKTRWHPKEPFTWFTEGTAAWSEVFVWGRVSRTCKVDEMFKDTKMDLYEAEDTAMPFWIYFVSGNRKHPRDELMVKFFEKYEQLGDAHRALDEVIRENYGPPDKFFATFAKERKNGFWSDCCTAYKCILGPDGKDTVTEIRDMHR